MNEIEKLKALAIMGVDKEYHELVLNSQPYLVLKQALTPPTADEVCEALSEYWGNPVNYDEKHNLFEMYVGDNIWKPIEVLRLREHAPHLITMIGRFYEGVKE